MKERLIEFLAYLNIGQLKFEENTGLSRGFVNKVGDSLRESSLEKILAKYPDLNTNWLKTGEGEMVRYSTNQNNVHGDNIHGHSVTVNKTNVDKLFDLLQAKDEQIRVKDKQIKTKDEQIRVKDKQIKTKDEQIRVKDKQINNLLSIINSNKSSN
ncbi:hypothetical protein Barb6_00157 [Bacteroidales bacterium Barb6]|nr:hypothetical protein Barb6_00157 [Bacteroidales bacterium Barb6]